MLRSPCNLGRSLQRRISMPRARWHTLSVGSQMQRAAFVCELARSRARSVTLCGTSLFRARSCETGFESRALHLGLMKAECFSAFCDCGSLTPLRTETLSASRVGQALRCWASMGNRVWLTTSRAGRLLKLESQQAREAARLKGTVERCPPLHSVCEQYVPNVVLRCVELSVPADVHVQWNQLPVCPVPFSQSGVRS